MNAQQHLLIKLAEECAEVQQAITKSLLFGLDDCHPETKICNLDAIKHELNDLFAVVEMLHSVGVDWRIDSDKVKLKKAKVEYWMKYAETKGVLWEED